MPVTTDTTINHHIKTVWNGYPAAAIKQLTAIHGLILAIAEEKNLGPVTESIKWGEASYQVKGGTPVRLDWKSTTPESVQIYCHCQTRLIETFREVYGAQLNFEGKRALVVPNTTDIQQLPLAHCLETAMRYHSVKQLPLLGL